MRERRWALVVNEGAPCYDSIMELLLNLKNLSYAVILHNKDIDLEGKPKKPHYHVILDFTNAHEFSSIAKKFEGSHIENVKSFNNAVQYLIHKNNPEKAQYTIDDIKTNNIEWLTEAMNSDIILNHHFDFNKCLEYYDDFKKLKQVDFTFIGYLLARFPLDCYSIISKASKIELFVEYKDDKEKADSSIILESIL